MTRTRTLTTTQTPKLIRCAIYTRKSSEEGLALEFNSLDAQRESAEAYVASQKADGWIALPERYDDGGYSGGNMERPALDRLLRDIASGGIDCVVVYKVDRLSRSLMDFARIMQVFDQHQVSFVSVTQHFNTTHSMGRLTLNILLSFAQFEREIIGERIRDKIAAQRRKGKWAGGVPVLGYDVDRSGPSPRLVVNAEEAARVRKIFDLYLEHGALLPTVQELQSRGWLTKQRRTRKGELAGGRAFDKVSLHALLTNPVYLGKIVHKGEVHPGEHPAILSSEVFEQVADQLRHNRHSGGLLLRNKHGALLRGLLHCKSCGRAMVHNFAGKVGSKGQQYRYYTCTQAIKSGRQSCASGSLPAGEIERIVVDQIRDIGSDPDMQKQVIAQAHAALDDERLELDQELEQLTSERARIESQLKQPAALNSPARLAQLQDQLIRGQQRANAIAGRLQELERERVDPHTAALALEQFDGLWKCLTPRERMRVMALLVQRVDYCAHEGTVTVTFHPTGIQSLADQTLGAVA